VGGLYLYSRMHKSKGIDIIVDWNVLEKLKTTYGLRKNEKLRKYEIKIDEIDIDIYVPFYSRLTIPAEELIKHVATIQGFKVVQPEYLLALKLGLLSEHRGEKERKDKIDIMALLLADVIDFKKFYAILKQHRLENFLTRLIDLVQTFKELKYIPLNLKEFKLRKQRLLRLLNGLR